ncbi:RP-L34e [Lepeophtheirus salmonis]|uniref:Large ribosomal subunit protein eL34 n=1 Tax=Lepeophtheirus salmonis TaxID=72036 RepID=C1BVF2_LEPSM|nr:60S ribosomal protein L34-like [Lepeophtheirus salmonis]ACO13005.1 60S ribosomal protein L34 [Lepeophtheirus salmonis]CAB4057747.1 RP-L34e [Lepeophtheirus salmonis]CAF2822006.1 RP-L34e [Lepeophtheirus salmonis]
MVQRITYRRRLSYNTKSNRRKVIRTPGGKLVFQYLKKRPSVPKCPMTGLRLKGIKPSRPADRKRLYKRERKVYRAYGGVLSHQAVKEKIIRAFLIEEEKMVMKLKKTQELVAAAASKD